MPSTMNVLKSLLILGLTATVALAVESRRPYEEGPLTAEDFRGKDDDTPRAVAKTVTQLVYDFRYRYKTTGRLTTASLESITIEAYIRRDESWNRHPEDDKLLDHEQGHADIAQIHCLKARLAFRKKLGKGPNLTATSSTVAAAAAALEREVRKEMAAFEQQARDADAEYDRETLNGLGGKQAEWRRVQTETLKQLDAEWNKRKPPIAITAE
jgi:hypothetical protein